MFSNLMIKIKISSMVLLIGLCSPAKSSTEDMRLAEQTIRRTAVYLDQKVIDTAIRTYCANAGGAAGQFVMTGTMQYVYSYFGVRFRPTEHIEDDLGYYAGLVLGYHAGEFIVVMRHKITDRVIPASYNLLMTSMISGRLAIERKVDGISHYLVGNLNKWADCLGSKPK